MRRTQLFLPTLKETPAEAQIVSHRLMLRAGMVRQSAAGIYTWLPMGLRVLQKIAQIVREEQDATGAQEVLMPTIQSADLWRKSGRYDDYAVCVPLSRIGRPTLPLHRRRRRRRVADGSRQSHVELRVAKSR